MQTKGKSVVHAVGIKAASATQPAMRTGSFAGLFWLLLGPGLLAMIGDNDAGGVISYAATGVQFGAGVFFLVILLLAPVTYSIQEMTMRLGSVSGRPFPALVFEKFGRFWGAFSLIALFIENLLTLITEFIGMGVGLTALGLPFTPAVLLCAVGVTAFALYGRYWSKERLALGVGLLNVVFVVLAMMTSSHDTLNAPASALSPHVADTTFLFYIVATVGNAVAPWMIFFQGAAVLDKGMTQHDLRFGRLDTALGSAVQCGIALAILACGASLHGYAAHHPAVLSQPAAMLQGFLLQSGAWVRDMFAIGMINAGFLAAVTISLSTSWTFAGVLGWAHSLNDKPREAPKFYALYVGGLAAAALMVLIPGLPLTFLAVLTQAVAAVLMIPLLVFLCRLTSDRTLMGEHGNTAWVRLRAWVTTWLMIGLCSLLLVLLIA